MDPQGGPPPPERDEEDPEASSVALDPLCRIDMSPLAAMLVSPSTAATERVK
jgi:hypothetical protein